MPQGPVDAAKGMKDVVATNGRSPAYPIESVDNALRLLRLFAEHKTVRIADAGRELGVARSTAHRLIQMLQFHGFVRQDPVSRAYTAGDELVRIGRAVVGKLDLPTLARPAMEGVREALQETVNLTELRGTDVYFLVSLESLLNVRAGSRTGMLLPASSTASGRALLAEYDEVHLREVFPESRIAAATPKAPATRAALEKALKKVRRQGYATNFGESEPEVAAVAVAVHDHTGSARAALSISAPISRFSPGDVSTAVVALRSGADTIRDALAT